MTLLFLLRSTMTGSQWPVSHSGPTLVVKHATRQRRLEVDRRRAGDVLARREAQVEESPHLAQLTDALVGDAVAMARRKLGESLRPS